MNKTPNSARRYTVQRIGFSLLTIVAIATVLPIFLIVYLIVMQGLPALSWEFITGFPSDGMRAGGILPAIVGTVLLTFGAAIFTMPFGIGAAIYLSEYATENRWTRTGYRPSSCSRRSVVGRYLRSPDARCVRS